MSKLTQILVAAAMTVTVLGSSMTSSQAAGAINIAPIAAETNLTENVHYRYRSHSHRHYGYRKHRGYRSRYSYRRHCFWKKRKVWSNYYGYYIIKKFRVCR